MVEASATSSKKGNGNGLFLYYNPASYYSQRVLMVLNEKKLKYKTYLMSFFPENDLIKPWFLKINPRGEVPVLNDGVKIIPDSSRITDYLEDNFSNGATPRLMPEKGTDEANKVEMFRNEIESISAINLTFGCITYPEITQMMLIDEQVWKSFSGFKDEGLEDLEQLKQENSDLADMYNEKIKKLNKFLKVLADKRTIVEEINAVTQLLDKVEAELSSHSTNQSDWWLCSRMFTVADIYLAVLLNRLKFIGLSYRYWDTLTTDYPFLAIYYKKLMARPSVNMVFAKPQSIVKSYICNSLSLSSLFSISIVAVGLASIYFYKKYK